MHCGYLRFLFLVLWAELAAGKALPTDRPDTEMQSIIEDLLAALQNYSRVLRETDSLRDLPVQPCTEAPAHLTQSLTVASRLLHYKNCAEKLRAFCPDNSALCRVVVLNQDLLQHLKGTDEDSADCSTSSPLSSSSLPLLDFTSTCQSLQCVECWNQQVAALRR
ncbi:uncharacterized protein LOC129349620 isoform X2 [Amphiprion ocellaris]|uniref:uncharacterized protein LOC129349620 isoform X2 n=1 Tax=Amphiprion ocellaris TaxID=80972 RepID=UPI002411407C|nr:uncharacterized protein LOC129349620 isoform X2 [Amphiprion ocellaris]